MSAHRGIVDMLMDAGADIEAAAGTHAHTLGLVHLAVNELIAADEAYDAVLRSVPTEGSPEPVYAAWFQQHIDAQTRRQLAVKACKAGAA